MKNVVCIIKSIENIFENEKEEENPKPRLIRDKRKILYIESPNMI